MNALVNSMKLHTLKIYPVHQKLGMVIRSTFLSLFCPKQDDIYIYIDKFV